MNLKEKSSVAGILVAIGIIFGDIGTSPLYVMRAIVGNEVISKELVLGGVSCVFWTLTIITSIKYVWLALKNDNHGEGGIFALYALLRKTKARWIIFPAIIGCAMLIADGFITPSISISSAVEGLQMVQPTINTIPIVLLIMVGLFVFQQFGTQVIGKTFGPVMLIWFLMLAVWGFNAIIDAPYVLEAINPVYAIRLLTQHPNGFWILGAVFLCTTGAEALYSDLGHCGRTSIRKAWIFVKISLLLNYFGQAAWLLSREGELLNDLNPFYELMPSWFLYPGIVIATSATIIASQALISGAFTLVNEAMKLKIWPELRVEYPSERQGQIYIPTINWLLLTGCIAVVLIFRESANMEAAYGLAITIDMLMTTTLLSYLIYTRSRGKFIAILFFIAFLGIEGSFFVSNIQKVSHGGWFPLLIAGTFFTMMYILYYARKIRNRHIEWVPLQPILPVLQDIQKDHYIPLEATNLVFLSTSNDSEKLDANIVYSLFGNKPKRAEVYWFLHVEVTDSPYEQHYEVTTLLPGSCFFVRLKVGFKVNHDVHVMFGKIVDDMVKKEEVQIQSVYPSLKKHGYTADFKFILLQSRVSVNSNLSPFEKMMISFYRKIKKISISKVEDFGLELSNVVIEYAPIKVSKDREFDLKRIGN